jgi:hypothetical protein
MPSIAEIMPNIIPEIRLARLRFLSLNNGLRFISSAFNPYDL